MEKIRISRFTREYEAKKLAGNRLHLPCKWLKKQEHGYTCFTSALPVNCNSSKTSHSPKSHITAEVCVPHLLFSEEDYKTLGSRIKCNPSIKTAFDREMLRCALNTDCIDVIGTDHAPHLLSEKQGGALKAVSGMPSIQFSLVCMLELVKEGVTTIEQVVKTNVPCASDLFQLDRRGYIRPGYKADLVIVNPNHEWTVTQDCIFSKCGWSPYEGRTFHSKVEKTFVNGELVYADGNVNTCHRGEALRFNR